DIDDSLLALARQLRDFGEQAGELAVRGDVGPDFGLAEDFLDADMVDRSEPDDRFRLGYLPGLLPVVKFGVPDFELSGDLAQSEPGVLAGASQMAAGFFGHVH